MTDTNKKSAITFLEMASSGKVDEAYQRYVAIGFKHHNPFFEGSAESLKAGMKDNALQNPNKFFEVKRVIAEDNFVVTHSYVRQKPDDLGAAVMHMFRFQEGKIVEMWDCGQPVPADSPNKDGMF